MLELCECSKGSAVGWFGRGTGWRILDMMINDRGDGLRWGDTPECLTARPFTHGGGG